MSNYPQPPQPPPPSYPYPSPYGGPPAGYYPPYPGVPTASPAARRAARMMFILGPIILLLGSCFLFMAAAIPALSAQPASAQQLDDLRAKVNLPPGLSMQAFMGIIGAIIALPGVAMIVLGAFVRRGHKWAIIAGLVLCSLGTLWLAANVLFALAHVGSDPSNLFGGCIGVAMMAAFGLLVAWLVGALRGGGGGASVDPYQQYLAQYYYHQQMAQTYGQGGGYGYGTPTPPPPPPPPPVDPSTPG